MKASAIVLVLALFSSLCFADDVVGAGCTASVSLTARLNAAWNNADGSNSQIYDLTVVNSGTCPLDNVGLNFGLPANSAITNSWNLQADTLYYLLSNFGSSISVGSSASAGLVITFTAGTASSTPSVNVYGAACPSSCVNSATSAPATSAPATSAPATSAPATSAPATSAPSSSSSAEVVPDCEGSAYAMPRGSAAPWTDASGFSYQIYDIVANNTGTCAWTAIQAYFAGNITQAWNYDISSGLLSGYGPLVQPGQVYTGSGFIFARNLDGVALQAPTLGRMRPVCAAPCSE